MKLQKAISLVCALLALTPLLMRPSAAAVRGDVDGNGYVQAEDARLCLRQAVGLELFARGSSQFLACDYSNDGVVSAEDARLILRAAVGLPTDDDSPQQFSVPMEVWESSRCRITLTGYRTKYDADYGGMVQECAFSFQNLDTTPYDLSVASVTINGLQMPDPEEFGVQVSPVATKTIQFVIPGSYFDISQAGDAVIDELSLRIVYFSVGEQKTIYAPITLYPTGKAAGNHRAADTISYKANYEDGNFIYGFQSGNIGYRSYNGESFVDSVDVLLYIKNKTNRDFKVYLSDIAIDNTLNLNRRLYYYVFAGTAAEPEIYLDPNFFADEYLKSFTKLSYTVTVYDADSGEQLFTHNYKVTWGA